MAKGIRRNNQNNNVQSGIQLNAKYEEAEKNGVVLNMDESEKLTFATINGTIVSALNLIPLHKIFKGSNITKSVTDKITKEVVEEFIAKGTKATAVEITEAVTRKATSLASKIKRVGGNALVSFGLEGGTEGVELMFGEGSKLLLNTIKGKEIFDEKNIKETFTKNLLNSVLIGGAYGGGISASIGVASSTDKQIRKDVANATSETDLERVKLNINEQVEMGNITQSDAARLGDKFDMYVNIAAKIPTEISNEKKSSIIGGIEQRESLKTDVDIVLCPPFTSLTVVQDLIIINQNGP